MFQSQYVHIQELSNRTLWWRFQTGRAWLLLPDCEVGSHSFALSVPSLWWLVSRIIRFRVSFISTSSEYTGTVVAAFISEAWFWRIHNSSSHMILVTSYYFFIVQLYLQNCDSFSFTYCSRQPPLTLPKIPCLQFRNFSLEQSNHDEVWENCTSFATFSFTRFKSSTEH